MCGVRIWRCGMEWTPCAGVCGVQIGDVGRNGRHVLERVAYGVQIGDVRRNGRQCDAVVASRLEMWDGMDAMCWSVRHMCGVQIGDGGRNGRRCWSVRYMCGVQIWRCGMEWTPVLECAVYVRRPDLEIWDGMDASVMLRWRPDLEIWDGMDAM